MLEMVYELLYNGFKTGCGQTPRFARDTLNILYIMGHSGIPEKLRYGILNPIISKPQTLKS